MLKHSSSIQQLLLWLCAPRQISFVQERKCSHALEMSRVVKLTPQPRLGSFRLRVVNADDDFSFLFFFFESVSPKMNTEENSP